MNIGAAVQETRKDLVYRRDRYFGTPVLYMQTWVDGGLVKQVAGETEGTRKSEITGKAKKPPPEPSQPTEELRFELARVVDEMPGTTVTNELAE